MTNIVERVVKLESQHEAMTESVEKLAESVDHLTEVLQQGKGALKILVLLIGSVAALSTGLTWILNHLILKVPTNG